MRRSVALIVLMMLAVPILAACQTTNTNAASFVDPAWDGRRAGFVLVEVRQADLRERAAIEHASVAALREAGIGAAASMDIFLPTRTYSASERRQLARSSGADSVITIEPTGKTIERDYTPPARPYGGFGWGSGGYRYSTVGVGIDTGLLREEPVATYRASLAPLGDEKIIWVGDFVTRGPTGMRFDIVGERFARYLVRQLKQDGMI